MNEYKDNKEDIKKLIIMLLENNYRVDSVNDIRDLINEITEKVSFNGRNRIGKVDMREIKINYNLLISAASLLIL